MYKTSLLERKYQEKLITAEEAAEMVHNNNRIHFGLGLGTVKDIDKALAIMEAIKEANAKGSGVASLKGKMIDKPVVARARYLLELAGIEVEA